MGQSLVQHWQQISISTRVSGRMYLILEAEGSILSPLTCPLSLFGFSRFSLFWAAYNTKCDMGYDRNVFLASPPLVFLASPPLGQRAVLSIARNVAYSINHGFLSCHRTTLLTKISHNFRYSSRQMTDQYRRLRHNPLYPLPV